MGAVGQGHVSSWLRGMGYSPPLRAGVRWAGGGGGGGCHGELRRVRPESLRHPHTHGHRRGQTLDSPGADSAIWYGMLWMVWYGIVWRGVEWRGVAWYAIVWYGMV